MLRINDNINIKEIFSAATPAQKILWSQLMMLTGENCAIRPLYYCGLIAGSEFLNYFNSKIYFCIEVEFSEIYHSTNLQGGVSYYNELNVINFHAMNNLVYWNSTGATIGFKLNPAKTENLYFSRLVAAGYLNMRFIGYRIIY